MKKIILFIAILIVGNISIWAQATVCDCKINAGKNTLVVTGSLTLIKHLITGRVHTYTYILNTNAVNKSNCTVNISTAKIGIVNNNTPLSLTLTNREQALAKTFETNRALPIRNMDGYKMVKVVIAYMVNAKRCSQMFDIQFTDETL